MIPKIIWQTHEWEYEDLPVNHKRSADTWKNLNPGWEYKYTSAKERKEIVYSLDPYLHDLFFLEEKNSPYYTRGKIHQADIFRYLVTYEYGGVYADMDSVCRQPLDYMLSLIDQPYEVLISKERYSPYNNALYAAAPKSSVLENVIKKIKTLGITQQQIDLKELPDPNTKIHYSQHFFPNGDLLNAWTQEVKKNKNVLSLFSAGFHSVDYLIYPSKIPNIDWLGLVSEIDYYGETIRYDELMEKLGINI